MSESLQKVVKGIDAITVAKKFLVRGFNVSPEAAKIVASFHDPELLISEVCRISKNKFIICEEDVITALKSLERREERVEIKISEKKVQEEIRIIRNIDNSFVEGKVEDFIAYFNSRLEKLSKIFKGRVQAVKIKDLG
ncbi:MAG: DNA polymerase II small subunit, partial [Archaeoglobaceae archaeon]